MDKLRVITILILLAIIVFVGFLFFGSAQYIPFLHKQSTVTINTHTFQVEVANTTAQKQKGLSGRPSLPTEDGMYFPFTTPSFYPFWMMGMKFPLDIIYTNNGKVVTVYTNVKPASDPYTTIVKPTQPANGVLEINAGEAQKDNIKIGDTVQINL